MSQSRKNKSIKRSRVAAAQIMRSAAEATVEPLEQRQLLSTSVNGNAASSVGINFTGGYSSTVSVPPWSVGPTDTAGVYYNATAPSANVTPVTLVASQTGWNDANQGQGSITGLFDNNGNSLSNMSVTWSSGGTWASAVNQPARGDERLMTGFLNSGGTGTPVSVTVSNVPYAQYDVIVYMLNDAAGRVQTTTLNGYSLYGSSPDPNSNAFAAQGKYLIDSDGTTPFYYSQVTSNNPGSPTSNADFEVFSMQGTGTPGSSFVMNDVSPGNGYINAIQVVQDTTAEKPVAPVETTPVPTINSVILNWQAVMGNVTYTVWSEPVGGTTATNLGTVPAGTTTFTDTTAVIGTTYNYWITATSPLGIVSANSNVIASAVNPKLSPPAPTNLTAVANPTASTITLNWTASPNTTGYVIQRSTNGSAGPWTTINLNGQQVDFQGAGGTTYVDATTVGGPAYLYRVGSINDAGNQSDLTNSSGNGVVNYSNTAGDGWNIQGTGDGLSGYYYNSITNNSENQSPFASNAFGATVNPGGVFFSRVDGAVDFTGANGDGTPPPNSPSNWKSISNVGDNFSIDWAGQVQPTATGNWTFYGGSDDGMEIDIQDLNGNWSKIDNRITTYRGITLAPGDVSPVPFQMIAGQKYNINVSYHEGGGGWGWIVDWSGPGVSMQVVPTSALYSVPLDGSTPPLGNPGNLPLPTQVSIPKMNSSAGGDSTASLSWVTLAADGYTVWRATENPNGSNTAPPISAFSAIATVPGTGSNSFVDTTVSNGTDYWYFVTGYTQYGTGPVMNGPQPTQASLTQAANQAIVGTHIPLAFTLKSNPVLLAQSQLGYQPVSLSWGSSTLAVEYHVYRNTTNSTTGAVELTNSSTTLISPTTGTSITDSTAQIGHSYFYFVVAQNAFGTMNDTNSSNSSTPFVEVDLTHGLRASFYNDQWWHSLQDGTTNSAANDPLSLFPVAPSNTLPVGRGATISGGPTPGMANAWGPDQVGFVPNLDVSWNSGTPINGGRSTYWSALFTGTIHLTSNTPYTFFTNSDDDSFIWVNNTLAAEDPYGHGRTAPSNTNPQTVINVGTTGDYPFIAAYSQGTGGDEIHVTWSVNGGGQTVIPQSAFTSTVMPQPETPDSGMALFRTYNGTQDKTITGSPGKTPTVTFTFTNDNVHNAIAFILERAEVNPSTGVASGDWMMVADAAVPANGATGTVIDTSAMTSMTYSYRLVAANFDGVSAGGPALIKDPTIPNDPGTSTISMPKPAFNGLNDLGLDTDPGAENQAVEGHFYNDQFWGDPENRNASTSTLNDLTGTGPTMFGTGNEWSFNNIASAGDENHPWPAGSNGNSGTNTFGIDGRFSSAVFTGKIQINNPGTYTFFSNTDDDGYLFVNGQLVSADGGGHGTRNPSTFFPIVITQADITAAINNPLDKQSFNSNATFPLFNFQFFEAEGGGGWGTFMYEAGPDTGGALKLVNNGQLYSQSDPLLAPTINGTPTVSNNNSISFNFTDTNTDELRYVLERSTTPDFSNPNTTVLVNSVGIMSVPTSHAAGVWTGTTTTISDTAIPAGQTFYYRIRAENYDFVGPWATAGVVNGVGTPTPFSTNNTMPPPTSVSALQDGNQVHLTWSNHNSPGSGIDFPKTNGGTGYDVQRAVAGTTTFTDLGTLPPNASGYIDNINGGNGVTAPTAYVYQVINVASSVNGTAVPASTPAASNTLTMQPTVSTINIPTGGFGAASSNFAFNSNGGTYSTKVSPEGYLQLTDGGGSEGRSAYWATGVAVNQTNGWKTSFDFTFSSGTGTADGLVFELQPINNTELSGNGGSLGASFSPSVGVYFNLWQNASTTGILFNNNKLQSIDVSSAISFHNANPSDTGRTDPINVSLAYNGYKLTEVLKDTVTGKTFSTVFTPLPIFGSMLHDVDVFPGFLAGTGGATSTAQIRDWSFTANNAPATAITGTAGNDTLTIERDATNNNQIDYWLNVPTTGTPTNSFAVGTPMAISLLGGNDVLNINESRGDVIGGGSTLASIAGGNIVENVIGGTGNDTVSLDGTNNQVTFGGNALPLTAGTGTITAMTYTDGGGNDSITTTGTQAKIITATTGNDSITKSGTGALTLNPGTGKLALNASAGTTTIPASTGTGIRQVAFSNITIGAGATVAMASSAALGTYSNHANRSVAVVDAGGLSVNTTGTLDMGDNDMILKYATANEATTKTQVFNLLQSGITTNGDWSGKGITSSEAAFDTNVTGTRALGWLDNADIGYSSFDGVALADTNQVLVKFTYYGDADLSGTMDGTDLSQYFAGRSHQGTGWDFADFDYDGVTGTSTDLTLYLAGANGYKQFGAL